MKTFSRDRIDPGWITPSTLMNEEGVKQSFVPVFKKSGWLDGGKLGRERKRETEREREREREKRRKQTEKLKQPRSSTSTY